MSLASIDDAFILNEEEKLFEEIEIGLASHEREKVHNDVSNLGNLLNLTRYILTV
jgi:hypothetical protein